MRAGSASGRRGEPHTPTERRREREGDAAGAGGTNTEGKGNARTHKEVFDIYVFCVYAARHTYDDGSAQGSHSHVWGEEPRMWRVG